MLERKQRYLQVAFNSDLSLVYRVLPSLPKSNRILIEAGTPFIKKEGLNGIRTIASIWGGKVVADLKTIDGAADEVAFAFNSGATAATVSGSAPLETIDLFIQSCKVLGMDSMVDMIGIEDPLRILRELKHPPDVVILHKGRDEESTRGKVIKYKHITRIRSKYECLISAAGGVDLKEARSAIFNGANIVVANLVSSENSWTGIVANSNVKEMVEQFLKTIE
jgi:bifunctional enzyme Fae/Hps